MSDVTKIMLPDGQAYNIKDTVSGYITNADIPTKTSDLTNDGDGTSIYTTKNYFDTHAGQLDGVNVNGNPVTVVNREANIELKTINSTVLDGTGNMLLQVPLVSGTNIKTINNESILGSGDISVPTATSDLINDSGFVTFADAATETKTGVIKLNPSESITLNNSGQLDVGGRLGQFSSTTGVYSPKSINPDYVGNGSFLLTEGSGTTLGSKSLGVTTGTGITLRTTAAAGATQYRVSNTYENRIICAAAVGGTAALNESSAATSYARVVSVLINGSSFVPDSSANNTSTAADIVITLSESVNPSSSTSSIRVYANGGEGGGFSNLMVGQLSGGKGGASVIVGQKVFSASGNACAIVGASMYNSGNGNALFGRQHISRKNRSFLAGTGHDTTNARSESVAAVGQWSDLTSTDTWFAVGNGTDHTTRSNAFEVRDRGIVLKSSSGYKWLISVSDTGTLAATRIT